MGLIKLINICKSYNSEAGEQQILKNINLTVDSGDFLAIMGPSGSGKSTLMNILGCLDKATSGEYIINGKNVQNYDKDALATLRNKDIGFVFQGFNLLPRMNLQDNVALPLVYAKMDKNERIDAAKESLKKVGLDGFGERLPSQISGGQQQRVAIARALVTKPSIILADEPTGNLDTKMTYEIMQLFKQLNSEEKITIILITHEPDVAEYARHTVRVADGQIVKQC